MSIAVGARLGPYEVLAVLGAGAMGEVYQARDTRLERTVAVKVLSSTSREAPSRRQRFEREARAISRLSHPHICTLYDVGEHDGVAFLVMEHLEGETLADRLEGGALPLHQALRYGVQVADALSVAHRQGVIHRDLKPGNIMVTREGVKLLDFGLAKLTETDHDPDLEAATASVHLTEDGTVLGTAAYMSPEQIEGREADSRTDIFALGVVLYEMATGHRPFAGKSRTSLITAILTSEPPPLATLQPMTPPLLERAVKRCLAKDREDRWQTATDLAAELKWVLEGGSEVRPRTPKARSRDGIRRVAIGALVATALASLLMTAWALKSSRVSQPTYERLTFRRGSVASARFAPDGETIVYSASWEGRPYEVFLTRHGTGDSRQLGLTDAKIASVSASGDMAVVIGRQDFRTAFGTLVRAPLTGGLPRELVENVYEADWSPDGSQLAVIRRPEDKFTLEFPIGKTIYQSGLALWSMRLSPGADRIALIEGPGPGLSFGHALAVLDAAGNKTVLKEDFHIAGGLAWSPDGSEVWLTATRQDGPPNLRAVSLDGKERVLDRVPDWLTLQDISPKGGVLLTKATVTASAMCLVPGEARERDLTWLDNSFPKGLSADGKTLLLMEGLSGAGGIPRSYIRNTGGAPAVRLGDGFPMALSPDGKWVLAHAGKYGAGQWVLLPTGPGSPRPLPRGPIERTLEADWLPDGKRIVFTASEQGRKARLYVQDIDNGSIRAVTPEGAVMPAKAGPRSGESVLVFLDGRWLLYPLDGGEPRPIPFLTREDDPRQWSADGRFLYVASSRGPAAIEVQRLDVDTGRRMPWRTLVSPDPVGVESIRSPIITPDGRGYCYWTWRNLSDLYLLEGLR